MTFNGLIAFPCRRTLKSRWGPVESPDDPTYPITCPWLTRAPGPYGDSRKMQVHGFKAARVADSNHSAVVAAIAGACHHSGADCLNRRSHWSRVVHSKMRTHDSQYRMQPGLENFEEIRANRKGDLRKDLFSALPSGA